MHCIALLGWVAKRMIGFICEIIPHHCNDIYTHAPMCEVYSSILLNFYAFSSSCWWCDDLSCRSDVLLVFII